MSMNKVERARLDKVKDTLLQELLKRELCVDDILKPKGGIEGGKPREKMLAAFHRKYLHLKGKEVQLEPLLTKFQYADLEYVFRGMDFMPRPRHLSLAKTISLADIHKALSRAGMDSWSTMDQDTRVEVLWSMGLAVRASDKPSEDEDVSRYYTDRKHHRGSDNCVAYGLCVTANERTDPEWKASSHASYEAKIHTNDVELAKELRDMSRTRVS